MLEEYIEYLLGLSQSVDIILTYISSAHYTEIKKQFFHDVVLKKLNPADLPMVNKTVEFAQNDKGLYEIIAQTVGMHFYGKKNYVEALNWLHDIKQGVFVNHIAKMLVEKMMESEELEFDVLGVRQEVRESSAMLLFIEQYVEFTRCVASDKPILDYPKALQILLKMIESRILPVEHAGKVLSKAIPAIKSTELNTKELELLMQTLTDSEFEGNANRAETNEVRKVLAQAYQRAIINE